MTPLNEQVLTGRLLCSWHKLEMLLDLPEVDGLLRNLRSSHHGHHDFCACTWDEAVDMCRNGWAEGAAVALKHPDYVDLFATAEKPTTSWGWSDTEGEVVWDRQLSGADDYLQLPVTAPGFGKACRVIVSSIASAGISSEAMLQRAIDIAAGIAQLEQQKVATELWATLPYNYGSYSYTFKVHSTGDVLNLAKVAFFCGHPGFLRRLGFALNERGSERVQRAMGTCYGYPAGLSQDVLEKLGLPPFEGDTLLVNSLRSNSITSTRRELSNMFSKTLSRLQDSTYESSGIILE
jgi:hypothetical protein